MTLKKLTYNQQTALLVFGWLAIAWIVLYSGLITPEGATVKNAVNGTNSFNYSNQNWTDSMVPQTAVRSGATAPTLANFNGGPVQVLMFQNNRDDEVEFTVQLNHNYDQNYPDISPHVHWTEMGGTGVSRSLQFCEGGTNIFYIDGATGKLLWNTDNKYGIGGSGANRPSTLDIAGAANFGSSLIAAGNIQSSGGAVQASSGLTILSKGYFDAASDANWALNNAAGTQYGSLKLSGIQGGRTKVLTSTTAADFLYVSVPNTNGIGGHVVYTVFCTDGTDVQEISGDVKFAAVAKGTTVTATLADVQGPAAVTGGSTLTAVIASNVTTNNIWALGVTATTSLTTTNLLIKWRLETPSTYTVNAL